MLNVESYTEESEPKWRKTSDTDCKCGSTDVGRVFTLAGRAMCLECAIEEAVKIVVNDTRRDDVWRDALDVLKWAPAKLDAERRERGERVEKARAIRAAQRRQDLLEVVTPHPPCVRGL